MWRRLRRARARPWRFAWWWIATGLAVAAVAWVAPQQVPLLVFKGSQVTIALLLTYWFDRTLFRHVAGVGAELRKTTATYAAARILARALIALGVLVAFALGI